MFQFLSGESGLWKSQQIRRLSGGALFLQRIFDNLLLLLLHQLMKVHMLASVKGFLYTDDHIAVGVFVQNIVHYFTRDDYILAADDQPMDDVLQFPDVPPANNNRRGR